MVNLKVVETSNEDVFSELVRATNSQTKVEETQFLSLRPISRKVEQCFNTYEGSEGRLFLERRDRQYVGKEIPAIRIITIEHAAKCVAAMYCQRPDLAFRFRKTMYQELTETMFAEDNKEVIFYAACLTLYRLHLLVSNSVIPQNMKRFKWHMLPLVRALLCGKTNQKLNARAVEAPANVIVTAMAQHGEQAIEVFNKAVSIIRSLGEISDDRLKRQAIFGEMLERV
jgi:AIPR protein